MRFVCCTQTLGSLYMFNNGHANCTHKLPISLVVMSCRVVGVVLNRLLRRQSSLAGFWYIAVVDYGEVLYSAMNILQFHASARARHRTSIRPSIHPIPSPIRLTKIFGVVVVLVGGARKVKIVPRKQIQELRILRVMVLEKAYSRLFQKAKGIKGGIGEKLHFAKQIAMLSRCLARSGSGRMWK